MPFRYENIAVALMVSLAVGAMAYTVTKTKISAPFRTFVKVRSPWLGDLVSCPYCLSHWFTILAVAVFNDDIVLINGIPGYVATWAAMITVGSVASGMIHKSIVGPHPPIAPQRPQEPARVLPKDFRDMVRGIE